MENNLQAEVCIVNMAYEMFNDALYFKEQAEIADDDFKKWRYYRSAMMNFCASTEAWIYTIMANSLRNRKESLDEKEKQLLDFLINPDQKKVPKGLANIRNRIYKFLCEALNIKEDLKNNEMIIKYFELSDIRNMIMHFSARGFKNIYGNELKTLCSEAPDIIEKFFEEICRICGNNQYLPSWFCYRKSREI